jgi:hypothetical protein
MVDRRQATVKTREALLKVYGDHLAGVQKILNNAAEKASQAASASGKSDGNPKSQPQRQLKP